MQTELVKLKGQPIGKTSEVGNSSVESELQTRTFRVAMNPEDKLVVRDWGFVCAQAIATR